MARQMTGNEKYLYRVAVTRALSYAPDILHTRYYGPYLEKGTATAQGNRQTGGIIRNGRVVRPPRGTYVVQRLVIGIGVWEQEKPATWEPVRE